jgi:hypothetical protein
MVDMSLLVADDGFVAGTLDIRRAYSAGDVQLSGHAARIADSWPVNG